MNPNEHNPRHENHGDDMPDALRWQLRGLRRDVMPERDLWAGIAARIVEEDNRTVAPGVVTVLPSRNRKHVAWLAMAASVTLAVGIGWQLRPATPVTASADVASAPAVQNARRAGDPTAIVFAREADAMGWEYKAALREIDAHQVSSGDANALRQIDRGVAEVRSALAQDPEARFLFERLQKLYAQRLALTQRLALS